MIDGALQHRSWIKMPPSLRHYKMRDENFSSHSSRLRQLRVQMATIWCKEGIVP